MDSGRDPQPAPLEPFCPRCGSATGMRTLGGRPRAVCPACGHVQWRNPMAAVAVILRDASDRVLLVQRRGTRTGSWCIPCGHIEWEEEIRAAGIREMEEETGLRVTVGEVYAVLSNFHDTHAHSVGVWFLGTVTGGREEPGGDAAALCWFDPARPPGPLAFPTDAVVLEALARGDRQVLVEPGANPS